VQINEKVADACSRKSAFMSLNNISLPSQLLADLYQHALVGGHATAMPQTAAAPFLGKNGKNILIVVDQPNVPYLPDHELAFLTKVLTACQLGLLDVAIVNWQKLPQPNAGALLQQFKAKSVILFDLDPTLFGLAPDQVLYQVQKESETAFVAVPALREIEKTKEAKHQLWMALKELFGL